MDTMLPEAKPQYMNLLEMVEDAPPKDTLGPCVGDDTRISLGPCVGDDNVPNAFLGPCVGDDFNISALGPCVGDDTGQT